MNALTIEEAKVADAAEILALQKLAYQSEAELYGDDAIPPVTQTLGILAGHRDKSGTHPPQHGRVH